MGVERILNDKVLALSAEFADPMVRRICGVFASGACRPGRFTRPGAAGRTFNRPCSRRTRGCGDGRRVRIPT